MRVWPLVLLGLAGCAVEPGPQQEVPAPSGIDARAQIVRLSMQLAGHRPHPDWVAGEPDAARVSDVLDELLDSPELGRQVAWAWNESLTLAAFAENGPKWSGLDGETRRSLNWEPLAGVEAVVRERRSLTELVTAQAWPANRELATLLGRDHTGADAEWAWAPYSDGRPMAGMLSTSGLWARHAPDATNYHRRRANLVARVFVCADFFARDVSLDVGNAAFTTTGVEEAVRTDASCTGCHAALDPLAGFFGGFGERSEASDLEPWLAYSPGLAAHTAGAFPPAWYGSPAADLSELGPLIASDPRFPRCLASNTYTWLTGADFGTEPAREEIVAAFVADDLQMEGLIRSVVATDAWRAPTERVASAQQLASALSEAYALPAGDWGVWPALETAVFDGELRAMSGDTDDDTVLIRDSNAGAGMQLVAEWIGRTAAREAVELDAARPSEERRLLPSAESPSEADHRAALAALYTRFVSVEVAPDSEAVDRLWALYESGSGEPASRYTEVLLALSRHPRVVLH